MHQAINTQSTDTSAKPFISVGIEKEPFNEFENNPALFYGSFPHLFLLGKGLLQQGSLPKLAVRHLLLQYDCRSSQCLRLIFLLFDQMKRHAAAQTVAARVKMNPDSISQFSNWISDKSFMHKLNTARQYPEAAESKEMLALITKHISLFETKIPFTSGQRHGSMSHLLAMIVHFGFPSDFVTFAVDDIYGLHNIRTSVPQINNYSFPAVDNGLTNALKSGANTFANMPISSDNLKTLLATHPVQATEVFRLIVNSVFAQGFGMPTTEHAKLTVPFCERRKGFAGT